MLRGRPLRISPLPLIFISDEREGFFYLISNSHYVSLSLMDRKLLVLVLVFFLVLGAFSISVFYTGSQRQIRASKRVVDKSQSLCFGGPLNLKVGEKADLTCVSRDNEQKPVTDAECCFTSTTGVISPSCGKSDGNGITRASVTQATGGLNEITCTINGTEQVGTISLSYTP